MEFNLDAAQIAELLKTEDVGTIEFTEKDWGQTGGEGCRPPMMEGGCQTACQSGGSAAPTNLDSYEKDFYEIFNKAKEYRQRVVESVKQAPMQGGQTKREPNPTIIIMGQIAKTVRDTKQYAEITKWTDFIKIAKVILDKAKENTKITDLANQKLIDEYTRLAKNPKQFDVIIKIELAKPPKSKAKKAAQSRPWGKAMMNGYFY